MAVRKECSPTRPGSTKYCRTSPRCDHEWWFDTMYRKVRYKMLVNEFAIPRMPEGERRPVTSKQEAERKWEPLFLGEIIAGRDPRIAPHAREPQSSTTETVSDFLDRYVKEYVKPKKLRSIASVQSRIMVLKQYLGDEPVSILEQPDRLNWFKTESEYADDVELATVHRALEVVRTAINWGRAQKPPLLAGSPFHRFGVTLNKKEETSRDRRLSRDEEKRLLDTALQRMNTGEHQFVGPLLHDRIIGALELCCRRGEMLLIQNRRVYTETNQIGIPGATAKDRENRRVPFDPEGRLAAILSRRRKVGPLAYVFGTSNGEYQPNIQTAWETLKLLAYGFEPRRGADGEAWNRERLREIDLRWHDLRHEGACRLLADGVDVRTIQLMLGHASLVQTQRYLNLTDEELRKAMEVSWDRKRQQRLLEENERKEQRLRLVAEA
jgi:integrase